MKKFLWSVANGSLTDNFLEYYYSLNTNIAGYKSLKERQTERQTD